MVRWNESRSITSEILSNVLKPLKELEVAQDEVTTNAPKIFLFVDVMETVLA